MTRETEGEHVRNFLEFMTSEANKPNTGTQDRPASRPRNSASLIILDRSTRSPKILMGRRHRNQRFMPGVFVFPGGSVEPSDRHMPVVGTLSARAEDALLKEVSPPSSLLARALALAAIREAYEETGLLLGTKSYGPPDAPEDSTWKKFAEAGVFPDIEKLSFVARAITPPGLVKRFDTRFFVIDRREIAEQQSGFVGPDSELTELVWIPLKEAENLDLAMITRTIIGELRQRLAAGMSELLPVPFYRVQHRKAVRELL